MSQSEGKRMDPLRPPPPPTGYPMPPVGAQPVGWDPKTVMIAITVILGGAGGVTGVGLTQNADRARVARATAEVMTEKLAVVETELKESRAQQKVIVRQLTEQGHEIKELSSTVKVLADRLERRRR